MKNSFKELQELQEKQYQDNLMNVKKSMDGNLGFIAQFVQIIDLYFSKLINLFINWSGGNSDDVKK